MIKISHSDVIRIRESMQEAGRLLAESVTALNEALNRRMVEETIKGISPPSRRCPYCKGQKEYSIGPLPQDIRTCSFCKGNGFITAYSPPTLDT